jgi:DNA invertase Pin-like site-specific DNA recombinase
MGVVAYLRVSTEEQAASGLGLEAQLHAVESWAARQGLAVASVHQDDVTGAAPLDKRPGLVDAVAALGKGDVLCVSKRDRLGRDPIVVAMIEAAAGRKGCRVASASGEGTDDDEPGSVLMRRMVDAFAEYERLLIKSRTRAALGAKRRRGERTGNVPFGMDVVDDGRRSKTGNLPVALVANPAELAIVLEVKAMHAAGLSLRKIASALDARGIRPKTGRPSRWSHTAVRNLILRPDPESDPL